MLPAAIDLAAVLAPRRVVFIAGRQERDPVLATMADLLAEDWPDEQRAAFHKALIDREAVTTTAIGNGIAVPHARMPDLAACRMGLGIAPAGIAWPAKDGMPVHLVVMIAARDAGRTEHLHLLAAVAARLNDAACRSAILGAGSVDEALAVFTQQR